MPPRKHKKKRRRLENTAPLYTEDIGSEGIKTPSMTTGGVLESNFDLPLTKEEKRRRRKRMERFRVGEEKNGQVEKNDEPQALSVPLSSSRTFEQVKLKKNKANQSRVIGTSSELEKPYFRLTTYPKPDNVRPHPILVKSLAHIKSQFIKSEDFEWANEQLKSVRQDLTVQGLRNKFVLEVYETHGRILLEHGDLNEFHQCQTMIRNLTSSAASLEDDEAAGKSGIHEDEFLGSAGNELSLKQSEEAADEFQAYGILYNLVQNSWGEMAISLTNSKDTADTVSNVSLEGDRPAWLRGSSRRHALQVVKSVIHNDYQAFFRLYESAPHLSAYLMDFLVRRVRQNAYDRLVAAYRPTLSVEHFREALFLQDLEETRRFLKKNGAVFVHERGGPPFWVDCKETFNG